MTSEVATRRSRLVSQVVATLVCAVLALLLAGWVVLGVQTHEMRNVGATLFVFLAFGAVGFVLALRQPRKPIGWLLLFTALVTTFGNDAKLYSVMDYRLHPGSLPLGLVAVFVAGWISTVGLFIVAPAVLLFPEGRLPPGRWRWVWWTYLVLGFLFVAGQFIGEFGILGQHIHVDSSGQPTNSPTGAVSIFQVSAVLILAALPIWFSWAAYQVVRYRRSSGESRQQLKWVGAGAVICVASLTTGFFINHSSGIGNVVWQITRIGVAAFPISIGIAMLKFRLYEIDRLISRTLAYAIVTGVVVGVYVGIITLVTRVLGFSSPVAVAASTLAAVALFNPVRVRVQRTVDRRFNRAHYDAEATVASFTARLRDAVDLETVRSELLEVVNRAVEPAHASVWIRQHTTDEAG